MNEFKSMTKITTREELSKLTGSSLIIVTASWCSFSKVCNSNINTIDISLLGNVIRLDLDNNKELCSYLNVKCSPSLIILEDQVVTEHISGNDKMKSLLKSMLFKRDKKYTPAPAPSLQSLNC
jgi:hypothetical protein